MGFENSEIGKLSFLRECEVTSVFVTRNVCGCTAVQQKFQEEFGFWSFGLGEAVFTPQDYQHPLLEDGSLESRMASDVKGKTAGMRTSFANLASYSSHQVKTIHLSRAGPLGLARWTKVEEGGVSTEPMEKMRYFYK